ncbi:MAG TPA: carbohydrate ABC transporter permease [Deinococcales bacterium]|nr:carbohydrate ABC transporter permease [Deinococcales bacterium]
MTAPPRAVTPPASGRGMTPKTRRAVLQALVYLAVLVLVLSILAPVAWLVISSVSSLNDLTTVPLRWIPKTLDFSRFATLFNAAENTPGETFLFALRNSLLVAGTATLVALAVAIPAAYAFSRLKGPHGPLLWVALATYMVPPVAIVLPMYATLALLKLLNTPWALIIVYCSILTPFATWLLKTNFDTVPLEVEESALIDGLSRWGVLARITVPLALPGVTTTAIFAVLLAWDEFFYALLFTGTIAAKTLPVAIADFAAGRAADYGLICAGGLLAALPPVLIAFLLQRGLISGLAGGSVKG